jgi:hypothetical protein
LCQAISLLPLLDTLPVIWGDPSSHLLALINAHPRLHQVYFKYIHGIECQDFRLDKIVLNELNVHSLLSDMSDSWPMECCAKGIHIERIAIRSLSDIPTTQPMNFGSVKQLTVDMTNFWNEVDTAPSLAWINSVCRWISLPVEAPVYVDLGKYSSLTIGHLVSHTPSFGLGILNDPDFFDWIIVKSYSLQRSWDAGSSEAGSGEIAWHVISLDCEHPGIHWTSANYAPLDYIASHLTRLEHLKISVGLRWDEFDLAADSFVSRSLWSRRLC